MWVHLCVRRKMNFAANVCFELFFHSRDFKFTWSTYTEPAMKVKKQNYFDLEVLQTQWPPPRFALYPAMQRVPRITFCPRATWKSDWLEGRGAFLAWYSWASDGSTLKKSHRFTCTSRGSFFILFIGEGLPCYQALMIPFCFKGPYLEKVYCQDWHQENYQIELSSLCNAIQFCLVEQQMYHEIRLHKAFIRSFLTFFHSCLIFIGRFSSSPWVQFN